MHTSVPPIAGILFDEDGTLVDFELTWGHVGHDVTLQLGKGDPAGIARLVEIMHHDTVEALPELVDRDSPPRVDRTDIGQDSQVNAALGLTAHEWGRSGCVPERAKTGNVDMPKSFEPQRAAHRSRSTVAMLAALLALAVSLTGCASDGDATGSIALSANPLPSGQAALRDYAATWGRKHEADPSDITAAINYGRGLRALTQYAQAAAVLEATAAKNPNDMPLLAAYGKALADAGRPQDAAAVLERAHKPDRPDWSVLSAQGSVADQLGDHAGAVDYYDAALKIRPGEPTVLSNMGLSYALAKNLPRAEDMMRLAAASPQADSRVRQNYALVLSLEGKFKQAEGVAATDLPPADAVASVDAIRQMIATDARWRGIGSKNRKLVAVEQAAR